MSDIDLNGTPSEPSSPTESGAAPSGQQVDAECSQPPRPTSTGPLTPKSEASDHDRAEPNSDNETEQLTIGKRNRSRAEHRRLQALQRMKFTANTKVDPLLEYFKQMNNVDQDLWLRATEVVIEIRRAEEAERQVNVRMRQGQNYSPVSEGPLEEASAEGRDSSREVRNG
jgi:hypothetical protein